MAGWRPRRSRAVHRTGILAHPHPAFAADRATDLSDKFMSRNTC